MLIMVVGALHAPTPGKVLRNVHKAAQAGSALLARGHSVICPHTMFTGVLGEPLAPEPDIMRCCMELVERADALYFLGAGPRSRAWQEVARARELGKTIYEKMEEVPDERTRWGRTVLRGWALGLLHDTEARGSNWR